MNRDYRGKHEARPPVLTHDQARTAATQWIVTRLGYQPRHRAVTP